MAMKYRFPYALLVISGVAYRWSGWLGCQLESWEWKRVRAGTARELDLDPGWPERRYSIRVWRTDRRSWRNWFKVRTLWTISLDCNVDEANRRLRKFQADLARLI